MIDLKDIKPKSNKSDKYSINLYRYFKKNRIRKIYFYDEQSAGFDKDRFSIRDIFIGDNRDEYWFHGTRLSMILGSGKDKYTSYAFANIQNEKMVDITDWFFKAYKEKGRCVWDPRHNRFLKDADNRFVRINKHSRKCTWCGKVQFREIEKQQNISRIEVWR